MQGTSGVASRAQASFISQRARTLAGTDGMYSSWENTNPFVYILVLSAFVLCLHFYYQERTSASSCRLLRLQTQNYYLYLLYLLYGVTALSLLFFVAFEHYFYSCNCIVSQRYYKQNIALAAEVMSVIERQGIPYHPDCASLLNVLRKEEINEWDHDADLSMEWPPPYSTAASNERNITTSGTNTLLDPQTALLYKSRFNPIPLYVISQFYSLDHLLSAFTSAPGLVATYNVDRDLIQVHRPFGTNHGPHIDM